MASPHHIAFFAVNGFQSLDLFGPLDAFEAANQTGQAEYRMEIAAFTKSPVATESGIQVLPSARIQDLLSLDTLVLCGGQGARTYPIRSAQRKALRAAVDRAGRVVTICTGAFLLARTGAAEGRRLATHWSYASELQERFPEVRVDRVSLFCNDGSLWSSAGVTAGIDLSLALIAEDNGRPIAASVARQLVVYMHRSGNQAQYSEPLRVQDRLEGRIADLVDWINNHIDHRLSVECLAKRAAMTPRHLTRLFRARLGTTPGQFVERVRLDRARALLDGGNPRIAQVASAVGYSSDMAFRRAFERRFEMSPTHYRNRFDLQETGNDAR